MKVVELLLQSGGHFGSSGANGAQCLKFDICQSSAQRRKPPPLQSIAICRRSICPVPAESTGQTGSSSPQAGGGQPGGSAREEQVSGFFSHDGDVPFARSDVFQPDHITGM